MDPARLAEDQRERGKGMKEPEKKMCELDGYGWPEETKEEEKKKADTEYGKARDRLRAIPSEMEVLLFLHDQGKIILAASDPNYEKWANKYNGVDLFFVERERPEIWRVYCAIVDAKNADLGSYGTDYTNLYLEIKDKHGKGWAIKEYATEHLNVNGERIDIVKPNRYLAYVRGGKAFGGMMADQMPGYSDEKSERENARDIVKYCFENNAILNHDIYIVSGNDVNKWVEKEVPKRQKKGITKNEKLSPQIPNWEKGWPLMKVQRTPEGEWTTTQAGKGDLILQAMPKEPGHFHRHDDGSIERIEYPFDQWEKDEAHIKELAEDQSRGLSLLTCLYAKGLNVETCLKGLPRGDEKEYQKEIEKKLSEMRIGKVWT